VELVLELVLAVPVLAVPVLEQVVVPVLVPVLDHHHHLHIPKVPKMLPRELRQQQRVLSAPLTKRQARR
jgi:hypothetical protein